MIPALLLAAQIAAPGHTWLDIRTSWAPPGQPPRTYLVRIDRPAPEHSRGRAVFMFGGGLANDIDWTTPGRFEHNGEVVQLTITGEDTTDGATLAHALVADGWTVIRYSALREDDPLHAQSRGMAESLPFAATVDLARFMWNEFVQRDDRKPEETVVLGHSLGACRGVLVSEGRAMACITLAGAYLSPTSEPPSRLAAAALAALGDPGADGELTQQEFDAASQLAPLEFAAVDADGSGAVAGWELAAAQRLAGGLEPSGDRLSRGEDSWPWPTDLLAARQPPVLALWGGMDTMSYHGPLLEELGARGGFKITTRFWPDLGHNPAPVENGRTGPIAPEVVETVVRWLDETFPR